MTSIHSEFKDKPETQLSEKTIWMLQNMRRANAAIIGCIEIINEHDVNKECGAYNPGVFIQLEPHQEMGLHFAIDACSRDIARIFDEHLEEIGVEWLDEICPKVTAEAKAHAEMLNGDITYAEYEKKLDGEDLLRSASSH